MKLGVTLFLSSILVLSVSTYAHAIVTPPKGEPENLGDPLPGVSQEDFLFCPKVRELGALLQDLLKQQEDLRSQIQDTYANLQNYYYQLGQATTDADREFYQCLIESEEDNLETLRALLEQVNKSIEEAIKALQEAARQCRKANRAVVME